MATKQRQTGKKIKENTEKSPGNSSNESNKNDAGQHEQKIADEQDDSPDKTTAEVKASGETESQTLCGNTEKQGQNTPNIDASVDNHTHVDASQAKTETGPPVHGSTVEQGQLDSKPDQKFQGKRNGGDSKSDIMKTSRFSYVIGTEKQHEQEQKIPDNQDDSPDKTTAEVKASGETESQTLCGNTEKQGQNTPNIDASVDNHTHVGASQAKTETEPPVHGSTVEQGQLDSKPDKKFQGKRNGGDSKSDIMKTSRFSYVIGCWRDELIVVSLVMTIVTLVFLLFVFFHYEKIDNIKIDCEKKIDNMKRDYEKKIDSMNIELNNFKIELTNIGAEFKKPNSAIVTDTCLQNDDIKKMNDSIKSLSYKMLTEIKNITTVLTETIANSTRLSNGLTSLNVSFDSFKTETAENHTRLNSSVNTLNETVERNITEKVKSLDKEQEKLQTAKQNADIIISQLGQDVDKIFPNTFNKGALTTAFVIVIVFVLALYVYVFLFLRTTSGVGRTGQTLINNNSVLSQIPDNCVLDNSICIVSFDEQRSSIHRRLVTPACQGREINTFIVRQHASLLGMPRCRLYIMCAEFSERHVIIEQPNLGLGDLKRCTHDAVRKIGGELVILYTRDPGSRRLADGQMFNRDIYCVNDQPELCALRDRGRFISLYDSLTPSQTQKLTETVNECLQ